MNKSWNWKFKGIFFLKERRTIFLIGFKFWSFYHFFSSFFVFFRSYYRCTSAACNVKKRVERSYADPTIVVTTYEGQHTHPSPVLTRSALGISVPPPPSTDISGGGCVGIAAMPWLKASNNSHGQFVSLEFWVISI